MAKTKKAKPAEDTPGLKRRLLERCSKTSEAEERKGRPAKGEACNVTLDFLGVGFLRRVVEDKAFRKKVGRELRGWDREVRKAQRASGKQKAQETPKERQNGASRQPSKEATIVDRSA